MGYFWKLCKAVPFYGLAIKPIQYVFVLGKHKNNSLEKLIQEEKEEYNDIIQGDFLDHFFNVTNKFLLALRWVLINCPAAKFIMKADDDVLFNIPYLIQLLQWVDLRKNPIIIGHCLHNGPIIPLHKSVIRSCEIGLDFQKYKWSIPCQKHPFKTYFTYVAGHGFITSGKLAQSFLQLSFKIKATKLEDTYVTGILRMFPKSKNRYALHGRIFRSNQTNSTYVFIQNIYTCACEYYKVHRDIV